MRLERGDANIQPLVERQGADDAVEFGFAIGAEQADDGAIARRDRPPPEPDKMAFVRKLGCRGRLGLLPVLDLRFRSSSRYVDLEVDQEFHIDLLRTGPGATAV